MEYIPVISTVLTILVIPWVVQLIKTEAITGKAAQWLSLGITVLFGMAAGFLTGIPVEPMQWAYFVFAIFGGVQATYTIFKSVGVTNRWLEALLQVDLPKGKQD